MAKFSNSLFFFVGILIANWGYSQYLEWGHGFIAPSDPYSVTATSVISDSDQNVYCFGSFISSVDFDPGLDIFTMTSTGRAGFIQKVDKDDNLIWAKMINGTSSSSRVIIKSTLIDLDGNIITIGTFEKGVDFDPGPAVFELSVATNSDVFIQKMDADGNFLWAKSLGNININEMVFGVEIDSYNNLYILGRFRQTVDFDLGPGVYTVTTDFGKTDVFLLKLFEAGDFGWVKIIKNLPEQFVGNFDLDDSDNFYITGYFSGTVDFDPGVDLYNLTSPDGSHIFLQKLNSSGEFLFAKKFGEGGIDVPNDIEVANLGNIYITGNHQGITDFDPSPYDYNLVSNGFNDIFICSFTSNGNFRWANSFGNDSDDISLCLELDDNEDVYISGNHIGDIDFDPGPDVYIVPIAGNFVQKSDSLGNLIYAYSLPHVQGTYISNPVLETVYLVGTFMIQCDLDPWAGIYRVSGPIGIATNGVVAKYTYCGYVSGNDTVIACQSYTVPSGDETYTTDGVYLDTLPNVRGCDSIITIFLTINESETYMEVSACDSYSVPSGDETYYSDGVYQDTLLSIYGCDSILIIDLSINSYEIVAITDSDSLYTEVLADEYQWLHCDIGFLEIVGADQSSYKPIDNGSYSVVVTQGDCIDTSNCTSISGLSAGEILFEQISMYPNPSQDQLTIIFGKEVEQMHLNVYSILGLLISEVTINGVDIYQMDLPEANGIYWIQLRNEVDQVANFKVIKQE